MAHISGSATNATDLLEQLRVWLLTRGWTQNHWGAEGNGYRLHMYKGLTYIHFRSYASEYPTYNISFETTGRFGIAFNVGSGYTGASAWHSQPGVPIWEGDGRPMGAVSNLGSGPFVSHQFFDDGNGNYLVIVERSPGVWRSLCWGDSLDKASAWVGGAYFSGMGSFGFYGSLTDDGLAKPMFPPMQNGSGNGGYSYVRADIDTFTGKWLTLSRGPNYTSNGNTGKYACNALVCDWGCDWTGPPVYEIASLTSRLRCIQDERAILLPMAIYATRDLGGMSLLGTVPSIAIAATQGMSLGEDLAIGSETWRLFNGFLVRVVE